MFSSSSKLSSLKIEQKRVMPKRPNFSEIRKILFELVNYYDQLYHHDAPFSFFYYLCSGNVLKKRLVPLSNLFNLTLDIESLRFDDKDQLIEDHENITKLKSIIKSYQAAHKIISTIEPYHGLDQQKIEKRKKFAKILQDMESQLMLFVRLINNIPIEKLALTISEVKTKCGSLDRLNSNLLATISAYATDGDETTARIIFEEQEKQRSTTIPKRA